MAAKVRPCLILSIPAADVDRALVTLVPHTTSPRNSRFEIAIPTKFLKPGVFGTQNLVTVPLAKLVRKLGWLPTDQLANVEQSVRRWLGTP